MQGALPLVSVPPAPINGLEDHAAVNRQSAMDCVWLLIVQSFLRMMKRQGLPARISWLTVGVQVDED